jgi:glycosyltransferase involved in cell wall biosynthesis
MPAKLSLIIPCYNSEKTLGGTLKSVLKQDFQNWEALIVNDGSTDNTEEIALKFVDKDNRFKYFSKPNEGLGKTRNYGIDRAKGVYILPLDSDNLVEPDFALKAIEILDSNNEIGVVHGHAEYFGERSGVWNIDKFDLSKMLIHNYIDACTIYRKECWTKVGGYDENMPYQGHEDWDFWITLASLDMIFQHLNQVTFKYFVSSKSMIRQFSKEMILLNQDYIVQKHARLYHKYYCDFFEKNKFVVSDLISNKTAKELIEIILLRLKRKLWKR